MPVNESGYNGHAENASLARFLAYYGIQKRGVKFYRIKTLHPFHKRKAGNRT